MLPGMPDTQNSGLSPEEDEALMDAYLDKIKNEYKDAWTEENWEEVIIVLCRIILYNSPRVPSIFLSSIWNHLYRS